MAVKKKESVKHRGPKEKAIVSPDEPSLQIAPEEIVDPEIAEAMAPEPEEVLQLEDSAPSPLMVCCPMCGANFDANRKQN